MLVLARDIGVHMRVRVDVISMAVQLVGRWLVPGLIWLRMGSCGAFLADPDEREVGESRLVAESILEVLAHRCELIRFHGSHLGAALAVQVFDFVTSDQRVEAGAVAEVNVPQQALAFEDLQIAVDR